MDKIEESERKYSFKNIGSCNMCSDAVKGHKLMGQRLNKSQGMNPKKVAGIAVSIYKCPNCDLIYSNPQPIPNDIQDHYGKPPESYWTEDYFKVKPNYFSRQIGVVNKLFNSNSKLKTLDIGAGIGKCMIAMENAGFDAYGLEPSKPFYERAIDVMKIKKDKLKYGMVEEVDFEDASFDFITFGAVFEHLYDPAEALSIALKWLKPDGVIHIEVPSSKHLISKIINLYNRIRGTNYVTNLSPMHPPFHLYEFGSKSFSYLVEKNNAKIVEQYYFNGPIYFIPKIFHWMLNPIMSYFNSGMQLTVYIKKNGLSSKKIH